MRVRGAACSRPASWLRRALLQRRRGRCTRRISIAAGALRRTNCASCHDQPTGRTPPKDALKDRPADAILVALTSGSMSLQAIQQRAAGRTARGRRVPVGQDARRRQRSDCRALCTVKPAAFGNLASKSPWNGWGVDASNSRYQPKPGLTAADVPKLTLKWAFGFPGGTQAFGHPVDRRWPHLRRQRQRHGLRARRAERLHLLVLQGGRRRALGADRRAHRRTVRAVLRRREGQHLRRRRDHR